MKEQFSKPNSLTWKKMKNILLCFLMSWKASIRIGNSKRKPSFPTQWRTLNARLNVFLQVITLIQSMAVLTESTNATGVTFEEDKCTFLLIFVPFVACFSFLFLSFSVVELRSTGVGTLVSESLCWVSAKNFDFQPRWPGLCLFSFLFTGSQNPCCN